MKNSRVATNYAITREQKRYIAKRKMKEAGIKNACKHSYTANVHPITNVTMGNTRHSSYFTDHWKEYTEVFA